MDFLGRMVSRQGRPIEIGDEAGLRSRGNWMSLPVLARNSDANRQRRPTPAKSIGAGSLAVSTTSLVASPKKGVSFGVSFFRLLQAFEQGVHGTDARFSL